MRLYGDVEHTGFYEKMNNRFKIALVLKHLWNLESHRPAFLKLVKDEKSFEIFANGVVNHTSDLVTTALSKLPEIRTWCKRENSNNFSFSCFCYVTQSTRISLVSLIHTVQENHSKINTRMRTRLDDKNSNTNARTQVRHNRANACDRFASQTVKHLRCVAPSLCAPDSCLPYGRFEVTMSDRIVRYGMQPR